MDANHLNEEEEDIFNLEDAVRCMFDTYTPTVVREFKLEPTNISLSLVSAEEEDPGALQSGVYLWPASNAMSTFLAGLFSIPKEKLNTDSTDKLSQIAKAPPSSVCELGAGCGLTGLTYAKMWQQNESNQNTGNAFHLCLTDRDAPLLEHMRSSIELNKLTGCDAVELVWGPEGAHQVECMEPFTMVLGADLIYSTDIISACFFTVSMLLSKSDDSRFILCSSFRHPDSTRLINEQCENLGLERTVLYDRIHNEHISEQGTAFSKFLSDLLHTHKHKVLIELYEKL